MGVLIKTNAAMAAALLSGCLLSTAGTGEPPNRVVAGTEVVPSTDVQPAVAVPGSGVVSTSTVGPLAVPVDADGGVSEDAAPVYAHNEPSATSEAPPDALPPESVEDAGSPDAAPALEPINGLRACPEGAQCMSDGYCHDGDFVRTPSGSCEAEAEYCYAGPQPENTIGRCVRTDQDWVICAYVCEPSRN